jgi:hypothetical protein
MVKNISTMSDNCVKRFIKPMEYVTNGIDIGRYIGTTARGTHIVAWGDKRDDLTSVEKLIAYLNRN